VLRQRGEPEAFRVRVWERVILRATARTQARAVCGTATLCREVRRRAAKRNGLRQFGANHNDAPALARIALCCVSRCRWGSRCCARCTARASVFLLARDVLVHVPLLSGSAGRGQTETPFRHWAHSSHFLFCSATSLEACHKLGNAHLKCPGEHFEIADADFFLPVFQVRNETAVHADVLGHVDLCPRPPLAKGA
jgi:hypothetical protein